MPEHSHEHVVTLPLNRAPVRYSDGVETHSHDLPDDSYLWHSHYAAMPGGMMVGNEPYRILDDGSIEAVEPESESAE